MKKTIFAILSFCAISLYAYADVTIVLVAGDLKANDTGSAPAPTGSLLLLISAGANGVFENTNSATAIQPNGSFVTGDDKIELALPLNNMGGGATADSDVQSFSPSAAGLTLGLRWFPGITYAAYQAAVATQTTSQLLTAGLFYGTFAGNPTIGMNGGDPWNSPSASSGATIDLFFATASLNSTLGAGLSDAFPNSAGNASVKVAAPAPEPATLLLTGVGLASLLALRRRRS